MKRVAARAFSIGSVGVLLATSPAAFAQEQYDRGHVDVSAAHRLTAKEIGRTTSGIPIDLVQLTHRVSYRDLNLGTSAGAAELEKRVHSEAESACKQIDTLYAGDISQTSDRECVDDAVKGAMPQVHAAIASAGRSPRVRSEESGD